MSKFKVGDRVRISPGKDDPGSAISDRGSPSERHAMRDEPLIAVAISRMHDNPFDADCRGVLADMLEENGRIWEPAALRAGRVPLTGFDQAAACALGNCRFAPATFDKQFAITIEWLASKDEPSLTPRQWLWMWVLLHRYRKSVRNDRVKTTAAERYNRCIELLDVKHLKPIERRLTVSTQEGYLQTTMFDGER